jgi:hypothetical protein
MASSRRKHHKVAGLPKEIQQAVDQQIIAGHTYPDIAAWLKQMGHAVGKSSVGRYGKDFLAKLEVLKQVQKQAEAIISEAKDRPALELEEASVKLSLQHIMQYLLDSKGLSDANIKPGTILTALAKLQASSVSRERVKMEYRKKFERVVESAVRVAAAEGLSKKVVDDFKKKLLRIAE